MKVKGKVYLIGSGPGDKKLLTIRGKELIERAEVIIYDNLVNDVIIKKYCSETCEKIYVGKSGSKHTMEQEDINNLIVQKGKEHENVVRLKGGDPYIFGRGGEEAIALADNNVDFEVINGISSAYSVPTYAGIPVTHRGISASVAFITGHEDPTKDKSDINWESLALGVQTHVFLMGVKNLPLIIEQLVKYGKDPKTPVAVIQNGTYPTQQTVTGTLEDIIKKVRDAGIKPPSIIVVGDVVNLREKINWFERKPLFGKSIVVTRSREQASVLVHKLEELGANVIEMPTIKIIPADHPEPIYESIEKIESYDWIIFTSVNGVDHFFNYLYEKKIDSRSFYKSKICAIGPATADELQNYGIIPDLIPKKFISTEITKELGENGEVKGKRYLLPRADIAPEALKTDLMEAGAELVDDITVYKTVSEDLDESIDIAKLFSTNSIDLVTFTSSSTAKNFAKIIQNHDLSKGAIASVAIGPITAETAQDEGFDVKMTADIYTIDGLVEIILKYFKDSDK